MDSLTQWFSEIFNRAIHEAQALMAINPDVDRLVGAMKKHA